MKQITLHFPIYSLVFEIYNLTDVSSNYSNIYYIAHNNMDIIPGYSKPNKFRFDSILLINLK